MAGVVAGLRAATHEVTVFLPVDVPLVEPELLQRLGEACADAAVTQTGPLPAAFARSTLAVLERRLAAGELALKEALAELDVVIVEADPRQLLNVNDGADLERIRTD
jgi:molybdopterin-guanine dinucleotide biosynthesis protein A